MEKIIQPWGWTGMHSEIFEVLTPVRRSFLEKVANKGVHPSIWSYIDQNVRPDPRYLWILVSNMGASETWGSNINADAFSRKTLSYNGSDWGIQTFKDAGIYQHHKNKDKSKSYGQIMFVVFASADDGYMDRVESVIRIDREKARQVGAGDVVRRIDNGEYVPWSMGCKVKYDVCSYCGNRAATRAQYCTHMKNYPNHIITADFHGKPGFEDLAPDKYGLRIWVDNPRPVFFDFSRVWIGAAAEAKTLKKVASPFAPSEEVILSSKLAEDLLGRKTAANKKATITKKIEGENIGQTLANLSNREPEIPREILNRMGDLSLPQVTSLTGNMGIVLRPMEFQRVALRSFGLPHLADILENMNRIFPPVPNINPIPTPECHREAAKQHLIKALGHALLSLVPERAAFAPPLRRRMMIIIKRIHHAGPLPFPPPVPLHGEPILEKISGYYNGYRLKLAEKIATADKEDRSWLPGLAGKIFEDELEDLFAGLQKTASSLVTPDSVLYALYAHGFNPDKLAEENNQAKDLFSRLVKSF